MAPPTLEAAPVQDLDTALALYQRMQGYDPLTAAHMARVAALCALLDGPDLYGPALAHDAGKLAMPHDVLTKAGALNTEERRTMRQHVATAAVLALTQDAAGAPRAVAPVYLHAALYHHERWDGGGYPAGLRGTAIPLVARIVALADAYDAMTADRVYRPRRSNAAALEEMAAQAGRQFDPALALEFVARLRAPRCGLDRMRIVQGIPLPALA